MGPMSLERLLLCMACGSMLTAASVGQGGVGGQEEIIHVEPRLSAGINSYGQVVLEPGLGWQPALPRDRNPLVYFYSRGGSQIKNRGAEVFHQLHDTVRTHAIMSFIEEGVDAYQTEHSQFIHQDEQQGVMEMLGRHDIVVVTAISHSLNEGNLMADHTGAPHLANATRLVKWQIGYSFPSLQYFVDEHHLQICDTHFLKDVYGCVKEAVLRAPPLPLYYAAADQASKDAGAGGLAAGKERLVLIDNDFRFDASQIRLKDGCVIKELNGMTRGEMFEAYKRAVAVVDLWLPGAETVTAEGVLFDCCIIVANEMNGANPIDFPIDESFKVSRVPGGAWNYTQLSALIERALDDHAGFIGEFAALKQHVLGLPSAFHASVHRYFSSDIHFVAVAPSPLLQQLCMAWAASVLMNYPLATVQIIVPARFQFGLAHAPAIEILRQKGLGKSIIVTDRSNGAFSEQVGGWSFEFQGAFQDRALVCYCDARRTVLRPDMLEGASGGQRTGQPGAGVECVRSNEFSVVPSDDRLPDLLNHASIVLQEPLLWDGMWEIQDHDDGGRAWEGASLSTNNCMHLEQMIENKIFGMLMPYFPKRYGSSIDAFQHIEGDSLDPSLYFYQCRFGTSSRTLRFRSNQPERALLRYQLVPSPFSQQCQQRGPRC